MFRFIVSIFLCGHIFFAEAGVDKYITFFNSTGAKLAKEYRLPVSNDMKYAWKAKGSYTYKTKDSSGNYKAPYWTSGYFNGDKKIDYAYILISRNKNEKQLIAFVSSNNDYVAIKLGDSHIYEMGVSTQEPGELQTASGKGYWAPTPEDPPRVNINRHAISYFMFESAASIFIWDKTSKSFKRHWVSD